MHCVAAVLAWLDGDADEPSVSGRPPMSGEWLHRFLSTQDPAWLADELLRAAAADPVLRARLDVAAGAAAGQALDERHLRAWLERAIEIDDYVHYREAESYGRAVDEALDEVAGLVEQGFPDASRRLAGYALQLLNEVGGLIDDSDGGLGGLLSRVAEIHLVASAAGDPDPVRLAEFLVESALHRDHEVFLDALPDYAEVLGSVGTAWYRELVETAWRALPPKRPGEYAAGRFAVTHLMERLAEFAGGADALIELMARDLSSGYDVLRIAQRLCADGRDDEALAWLDRGMAEFPPEERLRSLAADCHLRAGRRAAAAELLWQNLAERPGLPTYTALHDAAADDFASWRDRALAVLGAAPAGSTPPFSGRPHLVRAGRSDLVEVLLWEGDVEAAWQAAVGGGCRDELWLRLARARADTEPADAIPILTAAAQQHIGHKHRAAYREAVTLLMEAGVLFGRCSRSDDFRSYLAALRAANRPKRALREELDRAGLP